MSHKSVYVTLMKLLIFAIPLAYLQQYISDAVIEKKGTAEVIGRALNEEDLKECVQTIYQIWISQDADVKKRGILSLYGMYSDEKMVDILIKQIDEWVLQMRGKIATDAVRALGLSSSKLALMSIHAIAFKYKHKQVRNATKEALSLLCENTWYNRGRAGRSIGAGPRLYYTW